MTRKTIAILIALAMIMIVATPFALAQDKNSSGSIQFTEAGDPGIIDPPTDPTGPTDPLYPEDWDKVWGTRDIDFGTRKVDNLKDQIYRTHGDAASPNKQNSLVVLSAQEEWEVKVAINGFFLVGSGIRTIDGFELKLAPVPGSAASYNSTKLLVTPVPTGILAPLDRGGGSSTIATGEKGLSGFDFTGELNVPRGTAHEGLAKAILDWTYGPKVTP